MRIKFVGLLLISLAFLGGYEIAHSVPAPSRNSIVTPGSFTKNCSLIGYTDGSTTLVTDSSGDNVQSNTASDMALQAAMNGMSNGQALCLTQGTYTINTVLTPSTDQFGLFCEPGATLLAGGSLTDFILRIQRTGGGDWRYNAIVENCKFQGTASALGAIFLGSTKYSRIIDVQVKGFTTGNATTFNKASGSGLTPIFNEVNGLNSVTTKFGVSHIAGNGDKISGGDTDCNNIAGSTGIEYTGGDSLNILGTSVESCVNGIEDVNGVRLRSWGTRMEAITNGYLLDANADRTIIVGPEYFSVTNQVTDNSNTKNTIQISQDSANSILELGAGKGATSITVTASPFTYTDSDGYCEFAMITALNGGTINSVTWRGQAGTTSIGVPFFLCTSETLTVSYSTATPSMQKFPI